MRKGSSVVASSRAIVADVSSMSACNLALESRRESCRISTGSLPTWKGERADFVEGSSELPKSRDCAWES